MAGEAEVMYITNSDYVLREVVGELLLIPVGKQMMYSNEVITVSEVAAYLWSNMRKGKTETQLCELLCKEYEVDVKTARTDIREMLESMCRKKLVYKIQDGWILNL